MIIFAYFRMKFSSLKMNNDREEEPPVPGRLMSAAFLAKWRSEPSEGPQYSPPSWPSWPPTVKFAILQKKNSLLRKKVIFTVSKLLCRLMFKSLDILTVVKIILDEVIIVFVDTIYKVIVVIVLNCYKYYI